VPGTLDALVAEQRILVLLACRLLFHLNSPAYPLWYLLFSVRVKTCLTRMLEAFLARLNVTQR
jgi:hypothetical protein